MYSLCMYTFSLVSVRILCEIIEHNFFATCYRIIKMENKDSINAWTIVLFTNYNKVEVVPHQWLSGNNCFWPPYEDHKLEKAIRQCKAIDPERKLYEVQVLSRKTYDSFKKASEKATKACEDTDFSETTETEIENVKSKTRRKPTKSKDYVYDSESGSSKSDETSDIYTLPKPPEAGKRVILLSAA